MKTGGKRGGGFTGGTVVYGDVLFIINFSMDFLVLFGVGKILHNRARSLLLTLAAAVGGVYSVTALFIKSNVIALFLNAAVGALICFIAYPKLRGRAYIRTYALFLGLSLLLGGGVTASYTVLNKLGRGVNVNSGIAPALSDIPLWLFVALGVVSFLLSFVTGKIFEKGKSKGEVTVTVSKAGKAIKLRCLADSGALLREPLTGTPVMVVLYDSVRACMEDGLARALFSEGYEHTFPGMRLIPCSGIGGKTLLAGFIPDSVKIGGCEKKCVMAVVERGDFGGLDGIVPDVLCR